MAQDPTGNWPWETGAMPETQPKTDSVSARQRFGSDVPMYTLPTVKDRRAENGRRPATVKDLVRMKRVREEGGDRYFRW